MKTNLTSPAQNPSFLDRPEGRIGYDIGGDGPLVVLVPGTSTKKTAVLVGLCFLAATFTFAIGNALTHSYFSSAPAYSALIAGVILLGCCGLSVAANGRAMQRVLSTHTPFARALYFVLRVTECLTLFAVGLYLLTSRAQWNAYVLAAYAVLVPLGCPIVGLADIEDRAKETIHAGAHRLSGLLGRKRLGDV